jgi:hypothetical protein
MIHINYVAPLNRTGYGIASMEYFRCLRNYLAEKKLGITLSYKTIGNVDLKDPELNTPLGKTCQSYTSIAPIWTEPTICFWHLSHMLQVMVDAKGPKIGISTFETDVLLDSEIAPLNYLDAMVTACKENSAVVDISFAKGKLHPIKPLNVQTIPHPVYFPSPQARVAKSDQIDFWRKKFGLKIEHEDLVLSSVGKFEERKSQKELLTIIAEDRIPQLHSKTYIIAHWHNPFMEFGYPIVHFLDNNWEPGLTYNGVRTFHKNRVTVLLMPVLPTRAELYDIVRHTDCFISLSKGEGWNLPLADVISMGHPVYSTYNSAMKDYYSPHLNSWAQKLSYVPAYDGKFFHGNRGSWQEISSFFYPEIRSDLLMKRFPTQKVDGFFTNEIIGESLFNVVVTAEQHFKQEKARHEGEGS